MPTLQQMVRDLRAAFAVVPELQAAVERLQAEVQELRERQNRNSGNSSRPPSMDPPWSKRLKKPSTGKKRGGQPGHSGAYRPLQPESAVDHRVICTPTVCHHCGASFWAGRSRRRKVRRFQVVELPPIRPEITEYPVEGRSCRCCGRRTWGTLPAGVTRCVGPRVQAITAFFSGACRFPRRQTQSVLADLFGVRLSLGTLSALDALPH